MRPAWQKIAIAAVAGVALLALAFWLGTRQGRDWADSKYLQDRDAREQVIAEHERKAAEHVAAEQQLAAQNDALKKQNEASAELLKQVDAANDVRKAETFTRLQEERKRKSDEIQNADPADSLSGLCDDAKRAGFTLSFCG